MTTMFEITGPCIIPIYQGKAGRTITDDNTRQFWEDNPDIGSRRGCYVFAIRAGKGYTPAYVGKATKTFEQEVFAHHKLTRYQQYLADVGRGTPVFFFAIAPKKKGTPNSKHVGELEDFLIQAGVAANPDLLNVKGTKAEEWGITGVLRSGKGKRGKSATEFIRLMKIAN